MELVQNTEELLHKYFKLVVKSIMVPFCWVMLLCKNQDISSIRRLTSCK